MKLRTRRVGGLVCQCQGVSVALKCGKVLRSRQVVFCCRNVHRRKRSYPDCGELERPREVNDLDVEDDCDCDLDRPSEVGDLHSELHDAVDDCVWDLTERGDSEQDVKREAPILRFLELPEETLDFLKSLNPPPSVERAILPTYQRKEKTLVLDLDETLVSSSLSPSRGSDCEVEINIPGAGQVTVYIKKRPHLREFLQLASSMFEVVVFTASPTHYANRVLDVVVDPTKSLINYRLFRHHCHLHRACMCSCHHHKAHYVKDMCGLGRDLSKVVIIDNAVEAFGFQMENGVLIEPFLGCPSDKGLLDMVAFLEMMNKEEDVRRAVEKYYQTL